MAEFSEGIGPVSHNALHLTNDILYPPEEQAQMFLKVN